MRRQHATRFRLTLAALVLTTMLTACTTGGQRAGTCIPATGARAEMAQHTGAFQRVEVRASDAENGTALHLTQAASPSLRIEAAENHLPWITTETTPDGILRVRVTRCLEGGAPIALHIGAPRLDAVQVSGRSTVRGTTPLHGEAFALDAAGSTTADLELAMRSAAVVLSGSGEVTLRGVTQRFSIEISGSGSVRAADLQAATAAVRISGSGSVEVQSADRLKASISGSGSVRYAGRPQVNAAVSGTGSVAPLE